MSLGRPTPGTVKDDGLLLTFLAAVYDRLAELSRATGDTTVVQAFAAGVDTKVFHGLGRPVASWEVLDKDADANLWRSPDPNARAGLYIVMQASAAVTVKLRFS